MERTPAEMMKEYVNSQQFESTADVMAAMKEMFADVVQRVMECELDNMLGYEKSQRMGDDDFYPAFSPVPNLRLHKIFRRASRPYCFHQKESGPPVLVNEVTPKC